MTQRVGKNPYYLKIQLCEEWKDFDNFYKDMFASYCKHCEKHGEKNTTIERTNRSLGYCKSNCIWADWVTQNNNRKTSRYLTFKGETLSLSEWSRKLGISRQSLWKRLDRNWSLEKALSDREEMGLYEPKPNARKELLKEIIRNTESGRYGTKNRSELLSCLYRLDKFK